MAGVTLIEASLGVSPEGLPAAFDGLAAGIGLRRPVGFDGRDEFIQGWGVDRFGVYVIPVLPGAATALSPPGPAPLTLHLDRQGVFLDGTVDRARSAG